VQIELNGQPKELTGATTVAALLASLGLDKAPCAVEVNARLVRKSEHAAHPLADGDRVEVVTLVGGG
jgi:sulfur carrier protein